MVVCRILALLFALGVGISQCTGDAETTSLGHLGAPDEASPDLVHHDDALLVANAPDRARSQGS